VLEIASGTVLHRLIGHEGEVQAVDWAPKPHRLPAAPSSTHVPESWEDDTPASGGGGGSGSGGGEGSVEGAGSSGMVVSSSGRDKSMRVWSLADGSCTQVLKLPRSNNGAKGDAASSRLWLTCRFVPHCPPGANKGGGVLWLVSSGGNGELLLWNVGGARGAGGKRGGAGKGKGGAGGPEALTPGGPGGPKGGGHSRTVFGLCFGPLSSGVAGAGIESSLGWGGNLRPRAPVGACPCVYLHVHCGRVSGCLGLGVLFAWFFRCLGLGGAAACDALVSCCYISESRGGVVVWCGWQNGGGQET
jgi:WD40 repeat protein